MRVPLPFDDIRRIAIIRRNGFGDVLCAIPLVLRCKELFPTASVTLFLEEKLAPFTPFLQGPDEIVLIPQGKNKYLSAMRVSFQQRKKRFDLAISAKTTPMKLMNFFLFGLRATYRASYVEKSWTDHWINLPKHVDPSPLHQALKSIHLIDPDLTSLPERLYPTLQKIEQRPSLFLQKTLLLSLSNNRAGSRLSLTRIATVCNELAQRHRFAVAISVLEQDEGLGKQLSSLLHMENKICITPVLQDFLALIQSADVVFSGDGGLVHLAAAMKKPSLFVFGGISPEQWGPLNRRAKVLFSPGHVMEIPQHLLILGLHELLK